MKKIYLLVGLLAQLALSNAQVVITDSSDVNSDELRANWMSVNPDPSKPDGPKALGLPVAKDDSALPFNGQSPQKDFTGALMIKRNDAFITDYDGAKRSSLKEDKKTSKISVFKIIGEALCLKCDIM